MTEVPITNVIGPILRNKKKRMSRNGVSKRNSNKNEEQDGVEEDKLKECETSDQSADDTCEVYGPRTGTPNSIPEENDSGCDDEIAAEQASSVQTDDQVPENVETYKEDADEENEKEKVDVKYDCKKSRHVLTISDAWNTLRMEKGGVNLFYGPSLHLHCSGHVDQIKSTCEEFTHFFKKNFIIGNISDTVLSSIKKGSLKRDPKSKLKPKDGGCGDAKLPTQKPDFIIDLCSDDDDDFVNEIKKRKEKCRQQSNNQDEDIKKSSRGIVKRLDQDGNYVSFDKANCTNKQQEVVSEDEIPPKKARMEENENDKTLVDNEDVQGGTLSIERRNYLKRKLYDVNLLQNTSNLQDDLKKVRIDGSETIECRTNTAKVNDQNLVTPMTSISCDELCLPGTTNFTETPSDTNKNSSNNYELQQRQSLTDDHLTEKVTQYPNDKSTRFQTDVLRTNVCDVADGARQYCHRTTNKHAPIFRKTRKVNTKGQRETLSTIIARLHRKNGICEIENEELQSNLTASGAGQPETTVLCKEVSDGNRENHKSNRGSDKTKLLEDNDNLNSQSKAIGDEIIGQNGVHKENHNSMLKPIINQPSINKETSNLVTNRNVRNDSVAIKPIIVDESHHSNYQNRSICSNSRVFQSEPRVHNTNPYDKGKNESMDNPTNDLVRETFNLTDPQIPSCNNNKEFRSTCQLQCKPTIHNSKVTNRGINHSIENLLGNTPKTVDIHSRSSPVLARIEPSNFDRVINRSEETQTGETRSIVDLNTDFCTRSNIIYPQTMEACMNYNDHLLLYQNTTQFLRADNERIECQESINKIASPLEKINSFKNKSSAVNLVEAGTSKTSHRMKSRTISKGIDGLELLKLCKSRKNISEIISEASPIKEHQNKTCVFADLESSAEKDRSDCELVNRQGVSGCTTLESNHRACLKDVSTIKSCSVVDKNNEFENGDTDETRLIVDGVNDVTLNKSWSHVGCQTLPHFRREDLDCDYLESIETESNQESDIEINCQYGLPILYFQENEEIGLVQIEIGEEEVEREEVEGEEVEGEKENEEEHQIQEEEVIEESQDEEAVDDNIYETVEGEEEEGQQIEEEEMGEESRDEEELDHMDQDGIVENIGCETEKEKNETDENVDDEMVQKENETEKNFHGGIEQKIDMKENDEDQEEKIQNYLKRITKLYEMIISIKSEKPVESGKRENNEEERLVDFEADTIGYPEDFENDDTQCDDNFETEKKEAINAANEKNVNTLKQFLENTTGAVSEDIKKTDRKGEVVENIATSNNGTKEKEIVAIKKQMRRYPSRSNRNKPFRRGKFEKTITKPFSHYEAILEKCEKELPKKWKGKSKRKEIERCRNNTGLQLLIDIVQDKLELNSKCNELAYVFMAAIMDLISKMLLTRAGNIAQDVKMISRKDIEMSIEFDPDLRKLVPGLIYKCSEIV